MGANRFVKAMAVVVSLQHRSLPLLARGPARRGTGRRREEIHATAAQEQGSRSEGQGSPGTRRLAQIKKSLIAEALPDVYKATEDKNARVRAAAAEALGKADEPYDKAGTILVKMLKEDQDEAVKIGALHGLTAMGTSAKDAAPAVRSVAKANAKNKKSKLGRAAKDTLKALGVGRKKKN